jgi:hypothetical protein
VQIFAKHRRLPSIRHYIPGAFVAATIVGVSATAVLRQPAIALAVLGPYAAALLPATTLVTRKDLRLWPLVAIAFLTLHFSYGLGSIYGIWRFLLRR